MRKTDPETLKVVQMVLIGSINKNITVNLAKKNILTLGLSGIDGKLIEAKKYIPYENKKNRLRLCWSPYNLQF